MNNKLVELIVNHLEHPNDTLKFYKSSVHNDWYESRKGKVLSVISYFKLEGEYDMIITMNINNKFSRKHWRKLFSMIDNRAKGLVINSDSSNSAIVKSVARRNGKFVGNDIIFERIA